MLLSAWAIADLVTATAHFCSQAFAASPPLSRQTTAVQVFCRQSQADFGWYRDFVAASYPALWARYRHPHARHFYEVRP